MLKIGCQKGQDGNHGRVRRRGWEGIGGEEGWEGIGEEEDGREGGSRVGRRGGSRWGWEG